MLQLLAIIFYFVLKNCICSKPNYSPLLCLGSFLGNLHLSIPLSIMMSSEIVTVVMAISVAMIVLLFILG